jgi:hypothetical protein
MTSVLPQPPVTRTTGQPHKRPRAVWTRRDYYERLNLRRIVGRQQTNQPVSQIAPEQEDVTCEQN